MAPQDAEPRRKVSAKIRDLQTRLLGAVPKPSEEVTTTKKSSKNWSAEVLRGSTAPERTILSEKSAGQKHPSSLTARQVRGDAEPASISSEWDSPAVRPKTRLERSRVLTKHTERPDLFVWSDGVVEAPVRQRSSASDTIANPAVGRGRPRVASRDKGVVKDTRLGNGVSRERSSERVPAATSDHCCGCYCIAPRDGAPRQRGLSVDSASQRAVRPHDLKSCCCFNARGSTGVPAAHPPRRSQGITPEESHRRGSSSGDRSRARSRQRIDVPYSRRSKSVVRFFEEDGAVRSSRRSRSIEHASSRPSRGALRPGPLKPFFLEVDGCVMVNTSQEESGFESDEPVHMLPPDLLERFFYCNDGYSDDHFRRRPTVPPAGPGHLRHTQKAVSNVPLSSRRYHRKRGAADRNNNSRVKGEQRAKSSRTGSRQSSASSSILSRLIVPQHHHHHQQQLQRIAGLERVSGRARCDPDGFVDYRRNWETIGVRRPPAPIVAARSSRVRFDSDSTSRQLDQLNRNSASSSSSALERLDLLAACQQQRTSLTGPQRTAARRTYASLDAGSMGVDLRGPGAPASRELEENVANNNMGRLPPPSPPDVDKVADSALTDGHPDLIECLADNRRALDDPASKKQLFDSDVAHLTDDMTRDLYALPAKNPSATTMPPSSDVPASSTEEEEEGLPPGWEKHEDNDGPYYWHIKSGTIQREPPARPPPDQLKITRDSESSSGISSGSAGSGITRSSTSSAVADLAKRRVEYADKRKSFPLGRLVDDQLQLDTSRCVRFSVCSLGWVEIDEQSLTPERSSKAVNKCIVDLSLGRNDVASDGVGRWGDGKDLFMDLDEGSLKLLEPDTLTTLNVQPIHTIRVWGVGRDNGKDFAYVARDRVSRRHMCHVFRCDTPARLISNTLRDICRKIMIERSLAHHGAATTAGRLGDSGIEAVTARLTRPTSLALDHRRALRPPQIPLTLGSGGQSFPTPMEEPKRTLRARYMGSVAVSRASGIDVLNAALDQLTTRTNEDRWPRVNVTVAPSIISVTRDTSTEEDDGSPAMAAAPLLECRVRFLSFLGIGREVEHCGIIVHTSQDVFVAHGFYCDTSAGPLCKTVEAACKLRYQKCLDALPVAGGVRGSSTAGAGGQMSVGAGRSSFGQTLRSMLGSWTSRRSRTAVES